MLSAANAMDLDFIEVAYEEYDFAVPVRFLETPHIKAFIDILQSEEFKAKLEEMGGYTSELAGTVINV